MPSLRSPDLIGRDAELETLVSQLGIRAPARGTRSVLLAGDAGVGKTRLLTELRDVAVAQGWRVVAGHCLDVADSALPYLPFSEILGRLSVDQPAAVTQVTERHATLARLLPGRRVRRTDEQASDLALDPGNVFAGVHDLLETLAAEAPLLLVVEDAHWADQATRDMLSFLFSRGFEHPVALVVSYRADDLHRRHPLRPQVAEWSRLRDVERVALDPLSNSDVRRLVKMLRPGTMSEAELVAIESRAEGNPFFVEELVGASSTGGLPIELADVLLVRLDRLDDDARQVVRLASAAGRQVSHDLLAAVSTLDEATLERGVRSAVESNVLVAVRESAYAFRHALLGEAVYDDLLPGERARLHAAFVDAMCCERAVGTNAELAQHARRAGNHRVALRALVSAGNEAMSVGGPNEAATHFLDALEILGTLEERPDDVDESALVRRCAEAFVAAGRVSKAVKVLRGHLDGLPADASAEERGQLLTAIAAALLLIDSTESPEKIAAEAVELLADGPPPLLARALATRAQAMGRFNADEARETAMEALALAERHGLTGVIVDITTTLANLGAPHPDDQAQAAQLHAAWWSAVEAARAEGLVEPELRALYFLARLHQDRGEYADALAAFERVIARGEETGLRWSPYVAEARALRAVVLIFQGRLEEANQLLDVTGQDPPLVYEWLYFALQVRICVLRGRRHGDSFEQLRPHWSRDGMIALAAGTAELLEAEQRGDVAAAEAVYDQVVATLRPLWREWFQARLRLSTLVVGVHADAASGQSAEQRESARDAVERLLADGDHVIDFYAQYDELLGPEYHAWVQRRTAEHLRWRWAAQVEPPTHEELVSAWRATEAAFDSYGDVPELTAVRVRLAGVLRTTGDTVGARRVADLARESARAMGAEPLLARLTTQGSAPVAGPSVDAVSLTRRESEILALVAEGRSNGEIGKQLFIATKTVSVHVSNILGKLGAASRTEAAAIARRRGLL
ncbi:helix-turn-helix transcriptional regulator [Nocardioides seonyuensis]|uniref:helix-turn-helix transcriptional regulator n=1 Tax=Nocardioides seonyuensis TaxID=2518371 RepID=UPI0014242CD8|nr:helix-turn-helix transcriptional regulator [Nocardioides seonyuensis]